MVRRVLMVSTHGYVGAQAELGKPDTGGQVVYLLELSKSLARLGVEVDILTRRFEHRPAEETVAPHVRLLRFPCGPDRFIPKEFLAKWIPEWCGNVLSSPEIAGHVYDYVNTHYWDAGVAGEILSSRLGIPHLHTPHSLGVLKRDNDAWGNIGPQADDQLPERILRERILYHRSDRILATTAEQSLCLTESDDYNVPVEKIVQIPPGYDEKLFFPIADGACQSMRRELKQEGPVIFAAGRIATNKGYDLLIRALPSVCRRIPAAKLLLAIGSANPTAEEQRTLQSLRELAGDLGVQDQVMVMNCVSQERLAGLYRAADVFVLCSRYEPFGMTAIEAMACGTPTVITTHGGLWEELNWGIDSVYCDPCDSDALAYSISSILLHPQLRKRLQVHGARTVRSRYTWENVASRVNEVFSPVRRRISSTAARSPLDAR